MQLIANLMGWDGWADLTALKEMGVAYLTKVFAALLVVFFGKLVVKLLLFAFSKLMDRTKVDLTLASFMWSLLNLFLQVFVYISALNILGIETISIIALLGAAGLAVGLALQGLLSSLASGVLLILFRPFKIGDKIETANVKGTVKAIEMFNTFIKTENNDTVIVPNNKITSDKITITH